MFIKGFLKGIKFLLVIIFSIVLVTIGVDAVDHYDNLNESIVGRLLADEPSGPCPEEMVFVSTAGGGFCVDKYEAAAGDKCPYADPQNERETSLNINHPECFPLSRLGAMPWRNLTQIQAVNLCAKAGKRLPTNEEWFAAALGTPDKNEGWGSDDCQVAANWGDQPGTTGSGKNCVSYAGALDMIGNVWEWVKGEVNNGQYNDLAMPENGYVKAVNTDGLPLETDPENPTDAYGGDYFWIKNKGTRGLARGGYWENRSEAGNYSLYAVTEPTFTGTGVGFRCIKDVSK